MLRKYAKKFGQLPERPEHLVAFAENYGGVRFVDARAAMRMTGINTLAADEEEEEAAAAAAAEREEREAREAAEAEAEAQAQAEAEVEMEMAAAAASQSASPPLERKMSERSSKKVALKRWLARHGFGAGDGLEVLDAVDIREIADFEFVEVRDLVDGGMKPATAQRLLDVFAEHGTNIPASPLASNSPRMSPVRRGPHDTDDEEENDDDDDVITGAHQRPPAAAQGFATPQLLKPASRSRTSSSPKQQKNTTPLPKPDFDDAQGGGDDGVNEHVDEFVDDFDDDDEDADAAKDSSAAEEAAAVAALPAISSPAVRKAVSNSARRQARWQTRVETFLQEHDPELLKQVCLHEACVAPCLLHASLTRTTDSNPIAIRALARYSSPCPLFAFCRMATSTTSSHNIGDAKWLCCAFCVISTPPRPPRRPHRSRSACHP